MSFPASGSSARLRRGKWVLIVLALILAALIIKRLFVPSMQGDMMFGGAGGPVPVSVAPAIAREVHVWHQFSGRLEAVDIADVRARVSGTIERIYFRDGAMVSRGQPLFLIDPAPYKAEVARAEGQLASAEAQYATAKLNASRAERLMAANAIARAEYEARVGEARAADGALKAARGALETARLNLRYTTVSAPIIGRASRAELTTGNMVDAGPSAPVLTTIVSQNPLYISFEADEQTFLSAIRGMDAAKQQSAPVEMGLANENGTPHVGRIDSFDNRVDPASGTIRVRAVFENKDGTLLPGLFANVRIAAPEKQPVVLINESALNTDQASKFVYVVGDDNKVQYRPVKLGGNEGNLRVITEGLQAGERIVVNGLGRVRPDAEVTPEAVDMETLAKLDAPVAPGAEAPAAEGASETPTEEVK